MNKKHVAMSFAVGAICALASACTANTSSDEETGASESAATIERCQYPEVFSNVTATESAASEIVGFTVGPLNEGGLVSLKFTDRNTGVGLGQWVSYAWEDVSHNLRCGPSYMQGYAQGTFNAEVAPSWKPVACGDYVVITAYGSLDEDAPPITTTAVRMTCI